MNSKISYKETKFLNFIKEENFKFDVSNSLKPFPIYLIDNYNNNINTTEYNNFFKSN
jgi:hypothetical protein